MPHSQIPLEVYVNPHGDVVIRQTDPHSDAESTMVIERSWVPRLIDLLGREVAKPLA